MAFGCEGLVFHELAACQFDGLPKSVRVKQADRLAKIVRARAGIDQVDELKVGTSALGLEVDQGISDDSGADLQGSYQTKVDLEVIEILRGNQRFGKHQGVSFLGSLTQGQFVEIKVKLVF